MMLQIKFKGLAIQLQSPFFCANSNTQRVMHDQPPARKLFQILLHFGKSARYFSKLDTAPQDARKPFICPNISHNLPLCPVSNLIFQTSAGVKRKIKIQVVELKYSRVMENKFLGIRTSQKKFYDKKVCLACALLFVAKRAGSKKNTSRCTRS